METKPRALNVEYDPILDLLTIDGRKYTGEFFMALYDNLAVTIREILPDVVVEIDTAEEIDAIARE